MASAVCQEKNENNFKLTAYARFNLCYPRMKRKRDYGEVAGGTSNTPALSTDWLYDRTNLANANRYQCR